LYIISFIQQLSILSSFMFKFSDALLFFASFLFFSSHLFPQLLHGAKNISTFIGIKKPSNTLVQIK
jgi:hypothetical protein